jgi:hypothetical protein
MMNMFKQKKVDLMFPVDEIDIWLNLKEKYKTFGYEWAELKDNHNHRELRKMDKRNLKKYQFLKKNENNLRNSLTGVNIPRILPPPDPQNLQRFKMIKKWNKNSCHYNISLIAVYLYRTYKLEPCKDYQPNDIIEVYKKKMDERNFFSPVPSAPPPIHMLGTTVPGYYSSRVNLPSYEESSG